MDGHNFPSLNFSPQYLSNVTSWHEHLPFGYDLVSQARPSIIVELGVHLGDSYFNFCQSVKDHSVVCKCFGIDTWEGEKHSGKYEDDVWEIVNSYNSENYSEFSTFIRGTFSESLKIFEDSSIDILHIDGLHTYEAVKRDFSDWLPKVSPMGIILIHDIVEFRDDFGVWKFWDEVKCDYPSFGFSHGHGLGLLQNKQIGGENINFSIGWIDKPILESSHYPILGKNLVLQKEISILRENFTHLKNECSLLNNSLTSQVNLLKEKDSLLHELENTLIEKDFLLSDLKTEFEETETLIYQKDQLIQETTQEKILSQDRLTRMQNSFSWKVTSPLRFLRRNLIDPRISKNSKSPFDAESYLNLNPDLKKHFKNNLDDAERHFHLHGKKEGRQYLRESHRAPLNYSEWVKKHDNPDESFFEQNISAYERLDSKPLISIIVPVFEISPKSFEQTINSVYSQIYSNWELIIVDDCSLRTDLKRKLLEIKESDKRIKVFFRKTNGHISEASNTGIEKCSGEYVVFLDHDDLLCRHSLLRFGQVLNSNPNTKLIYSDEDKINFFGRRVDPFFKPDWNPDLLLSQNYICHLCCIRTDLVRKVSGFRKGFEGAQDWDLFLRITELLEESEIIHIPEILYHWKKSRGSTSTGVGTKDYVYENSLKTIESALERRNIVASVELTCRPNNYIRVRYKVSKPPLVSIIIPTRDRYDLLQVCIDGVLNKTSYQNFEILVLDNESRERKTLEYLDEINSDKRVRIIRTSGNFNYSKINNQGVEKAEGDLVLFLNNDVEPINEDWLLEMVSHAVRPEIGCVGAKLLFPNDTIQHGGVVLGLGGLAGHAFKGFPSSHNGYKNRLSLVQNYSAVTAACLLVKKEVFKKAGGFNEEDLQVAFNDVDLCLKIKKLGYHNLWTPFSLLYHYESASRGDDLSPKKLKRFNREASYLKEKWSDWILHDPNYNLNLTRDREDFSLGQPVRQ